MDCQEVYKLMNRYIDNEITPEEERVLEVHLERCKVCQKEFSQLKEMCSGLGTMGPSHDFTAKVMGRIQKERQARKRWLPKTYLGWGIAAAVVFICFLLVSPLWSSQSDSEVIISSGQVQAVPGENGQDLTVVDGEIRVTGHSGVLTAINSQIIFEGTKANVHKGIWDQITDGVKRVWGAILGWFSGSEDVGEPAIE